MTKPELDKNCTLIKEAIESDVDVLSMSSVQGKLMKLAALSGLSAECLKEAKAMLGYAQKAIIEREASRSLPASILKMKIQAELWEEESLLMYADRLNASLVHVCDALRTSISLYKAEMSMSGFQNH